MSSKIKRRAAVVMAVAVCLSSVSASAAQWRIKDYDTTNAMAGLKPVVPIVYQEFDNAGFPTGRVVSGNSAQTEGLKGFADAELKNTWISDVYPNKEYINLYADGVYTGKVFETGRDGVDLVEYKDVDFMWEVAAPHKIYSIKKAKLNINGKATWFGSVDKNYPVEYTGRNATVLANRCALGFGVYKLHQPSIMNKDVRAERISKEIENNYMDKSALTNIRGLSAADIYPNANSAKRIDVTGKEKDLFIPRTYDVELVGPKFDNEGKICGNVTIYGTEYPNPGDMNIADIVGVCKDSITGNLEGTTLTWTPAGYEAAAPYRLYEYLTVDGLVMDGRWLYNDGIADYYLPAIYRYTSAKANLKFRTIVDEVDANGEVILCKQVSYNDGATFVTESKIKTGIYPNAEYNVEFGTVVEGTKTLTPVYKFNYNGENYTTYRINGEWFTEKWGNYNYSANMPSAYIAPYVTK